jgi:hypothetical protein
LEALQANGGSATIPVIGRYVWDTYRTELERSDDFFYVWQYEMRWAGDQLVRQKKMKKGPPAGTWHLV